MASQVSTTDLGVSVVGSRTDSAGSPLTDWSAEEARFSNTILTEGVMASGAFQVNAGAGATWNVVIGSGGTKSDYAIVDGDDPGQGNYMVRLPSDQTLAIAAADVSLPRKDEVYIVVLDNAYDAQSRGRAALAIQEGTPAASPALPGADVTWTAYHKLATIDVPAAASDILGCTITDTRALSGVSIAGALTATGLSLSGGTVTGDLAVTGNVDGVDVGSHTHDGTAGDGAQIDANDLLNLKAAADAAGIDATTLNGVSTFTTAAHRGSGGTGEHPAATGATAGFMSTADKTKLDGIATGATANQTITAGGGITGGGSGSSVTVSHADTSSAGSLNTSGSSIIDFVNVDGYGHVTGMGSRVLTAANIGAATSTHNHDGTYYKFEAGTPRITISTAAASGGSNGDIWFKY